MNKLDLAQFDGHTPGLVYAVEWEESRVSLYTTGNSPYDFVLGNSKDSVKGKAYEEIAKRANAAPALLALAREQREQIAKLREALESCSNKLANLGNEFSSVRFTDRHGDGPACKALVEKARAALKATE